MFKKWKTEKEAPGSKGSGAGGGAGSSKNRAPTSARAASASARASSSAGTSSSVGTSSARTTSADGVAVAQGATAGGASNGAGAAKMVASAANGKELQRKLDLKKIYQEEDYDESLEYKVINKEDPQLPYGDGSDKLFGMENYGYTCYIDSIIQALYHTEELRKAVLEYPPRDPAHPRKRKLRVKGQKPRGFIAAVQAQAGGKLPARDGSVSQKDVPQPNPIKKPGSKVRNMFAHGSDEGSKKGGSDHRSLNSSYSSTLNESQRSGHGGSGSSVSGGASDSGNERADYPPEDMELERTTVARYPTFKELGVRFYQNQQSNVTVVGATKNPADTSEQRKRHALTHGPIINLDVSFSDQYGMKPSVFTSVKDAFEAMTENKAKKGVLSGYYLLDMVKKNNMNFRGAMHQDAHEFLNFLVNSMMEAVAEDARARGAPPSAIGSMFSGVLTSETRCLTCESVSTRDEKFLDLSIDLQPNTSLTNCLKMFSHSEMLSGSNKFFCETCHSLQEASKTIKLKKVPKILALHLKRFKYSEKLGRMVKLFYRVEYTKTIRIFNTTDDAEASDKLYELYAIVVHIGGGPYHGHYISLVRTPKFGWLLFDDETVESIDESFVFRFFGDGPGLSTAYLLFYHEVSDPDNYEKRRVFNGLDDEEDTENFNHERPGAPVVDGSDSYSTTSSTASSAKGKLKSRLGFNFMKM